MIGETLLHDMIQCSALKSHLLIVTRNFSNDSSWPITTNLSAKYNALDRPDCNLKVPLWQLVRASTAAPTYFPPETLQLGETQHQFVDGGITPYNNPAFLLYKKATMPQYRLGWPSGEDRMMLVSLGTGFSSSPQKRHLRSGRWLLGNAAKIPSELMRGIARENDMNCRMIGRCVSGPPVDREVGDMVCPLERAEWLGKSFLYARYDADISQEGLAAANLGDIDPTSLVMDNVTSMPDLKRIGAKAADVIDIPRHFATFMP